MVYHGHAGHLLLTEIPKVLKIRILAETEDRIAFLQQQKNVSREQALLDIENEDKNRSHWTRYLYKMDVNDPKLYDIVINIGNLTIDNACEIICLAAKSDAYLMTDESKQALDDAAITSYIDAALQSICEAQVFVKNGEVHVKVAAQKRRKTGHLSPALQDHLGASYQDDLTRQINKIAYDIPGVKKVFCNVDPPILCLKRGGIRLMKISIRGKIFLAFLIFIGLSALIWARSYYSQYILNQKIQIIERKYDLFNSILEARRYEKNYFFIL